MKVLITGSEGFLGQNLKQLLLDNNYEVVDFDYKSNKMHDIRNASAFEKVVVDTVPDVCVHLAAIANLNHYDENLKDGNDINVNGSIGILKVCEKYKVRVVFASTCCCYGNNKLKVSNEESLVWPTEPYSQSKRKLELEIFKRNKTMKNSEKTIICRLATFYGSKLCRRALATSLFIEKIHKGLPITVHGDGSQHRTYTHVSDMCSGFLAILKGIEHDGHNLYEMYNITRSQPISVIEIIMEASKKLEKPAILKFVDDRDSQFDQLVIENKRLRELGWAPQYDFSSGMEEMVKSFLHEDPMGEWIL